MLEHVHEAHVHVDQWPRSLYHPCVSHFFESRYWYLLSMPIGKVFLRAFLIVPTQMGTMACVFGHENPGGMSPQLR